MAETANDPFHNFPSSFAEHVIQNGDIALLAESHVQYEVPGVVNGTPGVYQVGGNWVDDVFIVTHSFFKKL